VSGARRGLVVEDAGLLTTVQDTGRWGYQHYGVSVSGAMDMSAHRRANRLVGNPPDAATLEITLVGPVLRFEAAMRVGVAGAPFELRLDDRPVSIDTVLCAEPGQTLAFGRRTAGARAYLAAAGGFAVPLVLGSRATHLRSGMGGLEGRALQAGDRLAAGPSRGAPRREPPAARWRRCMPLGGARVRVLPGPHAGLFDSVVLRRLESGRYTIRPDSDRMGYRLDGAPVVGPEGLSLLSQGFPIGAVQVVPSGDVIVAMADRQTAGGYPRVAAVIAADIPVLGQLAPRDWIEFEPCDQRTAREALRASEFECESDRGN
jgi:biotin-dependent carboxylase-like uncharacterized protein